MLAVGDEAERDAGAAQQFRHAGVGRGFPERAAEGLGEILAGRMDVDEERGLSVVGEKRDVGAQGLVMLGD